jgi:hypothetical protein
MVWHPAHQPPALPAFRAAIEQPLAGNPQQANSPQARAG